MGYYIWNRQAMGLKGKTSALGREGGVSGLLLLCCCLLCLFRTAKVGACGRSY